MNLKLAVAFAAALGSTPVVVAQHGSWAESNASHAAMECKVGIGRPTAFAGGNSGPVRVTSLIGAAAVGNLVCTAS